jgi:hypothetical protein
MPSGVLAGPGVVDRVVAQVLRHLLAGVEALLDLGVGDVAGDDQRPGERHRVLTGCLVSSARISSIGRFRSIATTGRDAVARRGAPR